MKGKQWGLVAAVAALMMMHSSDAPACGPFPEETIFSYESYPRFGLDRYAAGELGVIQPTYWRRFLLVAYRYFSATPLNDAEQATFTGHPPRTPTGPVGGEQQWRDARARVSGFPELPAYLPTYRRVPESQWQQFMNCADDAFATAADTLNSRIEQFSADNDGVRRWVAAQDQVFSNCGEGETIPPEPEPDLPPLLAADRRYQIAAANFYAVNLADAQMMFEAIAEDDSSPWRDIAPYLAARSLIRRATLDPRPGLIDLDMISMASNRLRRILEDPTRESVHDAARSLLEYADAKIMPARRLVAVADALSTSAASADFRQNLTDYEFLMDHDFPAKPEARVENDLIDWVMAIQAGEFDHALDKWRETGSTPWLVAAMVHAPAGGPSSEELRAAAESIGFDGPAWPTLAHHRLRQMMELGQNDTARDELDELLPRIRESLPTPALNLFLEQRFALVRDLGEVLRLAPRTPVGRGFGMPDVYAGSLPEDTPETLFDSDSVRLFNQGLPLDMLAEAATDDTLSEHLRAQIVLITWVRAALLERWEVAEELAGPLREQFPSLGPDLDQWLAAAPEDRRFATAYLLLRHPRMKPHLRTGLGMKLNLEGIDDLRDNWWCSFSLPEDLDRYAYWRFNASTSTLDLGGAVPQPDPPAFLTDDQRSALVEEWKALQSLETAPNYLAAIATDYAAAHPEDPRSPEALHLAVRATRYGCTDSGTGTRSRAAFQLLHRRWPDSQWAEETPYWFN